MPRRKWKSIGAAPGGVFTYHKYITEHALLLRHHHPILLSVEQFSLPFSFRWPFFKIVLGFGNGFRKGVGGERLYFVAGFSGLKRYAKLWRAACSLTWRLARPVLSLRGDNFTTTTFQDFPFILHGAYLVILQLFKAF